MLKEPFCQIAVVDADGRGERTALPYVVGSTRGTSGFATPAWIPGRHAFVTTRGGDDDPTIVRVDTRPVSHRLLRQVGAAVLAAAPDGTFAYQRFEPYPYAIVVSASDGTPRTTIQLPETTGGVSLVFR